MCSGTYCTRTIFSSALVSIASLFCAVTVASNCLAFSASFSACLSSASALSLLNTPSCTNSFTRLTVVALNCSSDSRSPAFALASIVVDRQSDRSAVDNNFADRLALIASPSLVVCINFLIYLLFPYSKYF